MAKHRSRSERIQGPAGRSLTVQLPLPVLGVLGDTREAFHALCIRTGQEVLMAMMEAEREALCGPKGLIKSIAGHGEGGAARAE